MRMRWLRRTHLIFSVPLALGAAALLAYGARWHPQAVLMEQEVRLPVAPAPMYGPDPFGLPPDVPQPVMVKTVALEESEARLIFEITIGGVMRLPTGEIKRTYRGAPPSLCPT